MASVLALLSQLFGGGCGKSDYQPADIYVDLRNQVLRLGPKEIGLTPSPTNPKVYGVLMETGYPEAVATLVALTGGDASLYFSNGGGIIGAGHTEAVAKSAKALVAEAEGFLQERKPAGDFPLPRKSGTRFYLLTTDGILTAEVKEDDLGNSRHRLSPLFHKAHELIVEVRLTEEQRTKNEAGHSPQ